MAASPTTTSTTSAVPAADRAVEEISSLCMSCHRDGTTRLLLTHIPFFREVILMSFRCAHCGFHDAEIQSAGQIQQRGVRCCFKVQEPTDLQRQVVKSDTAVVRFEELELEIPAGRGQLTNIEGLVSMVRGDLQEGQIARREVDEGVWEKIEGVVGKLGEMLEGKAMPFTLVLDDPAGNSSVEPSLEDKGGKYVKNEYARTKAQNEALGLGGEVDVGEETKTEEYHAAEQMYPKLPAANGTNVDATEDEDEIVENQVYSFPASCPGCTKPCATHMKMVRIPHFREVVIMSTVCDECGYRTNEVKTGGEVPEKGRRITLQVKTKEDLSRDILKAESAVLRCPELSLNVEPGTLGGRFTTVEGLLVQVRDDLKASIFETSDDHGTHGDSLPATERNKWKAFFSTIDRAINGEMAFTIILEDPLAASYVQSFKAPEPDSQMQVEEYERTKEEEDDLGLTDMKTEGYEGQPESEKQNGVSEASINKESQPDFEDIQQQLQARMKELEVQEALETNHDKSNGS